MTNLKRLLSRSDFRKNPTKAIFKRIAWRIRWRLTAAPWAMDLQDDRKIIVPLTGSGALVYYQGFSEADTVDLFQRYLRPGMTVFDIGSHFGEFTTLASILVGHDGSVHSFEPHPEMFKYLETNVQINHAENATLNQSAVSDRTGDVELLLSDDPAFGSIAPSRSVDRDQVDRIAVHSFALDDYIQSLDLSGSLLIKVDVEGAELLVFQGAKQFLGRKDDLSPLLWFENGLNSRNFGYEPREALNWLNSAGFQIYRYLPGGVVLPLEDNDTDRFTASANLLASKSGEDLVKMLTEEHEPHKP